MRLFFTAFLRIFQVNVFAQAPGAVSSDSLLLQATVPDSTTLTSGKPKLKTQVVNYLKARIATPPTRELKILGRSALVISGVSAAGAATYAFGDEPLREFMLSNRSKTSEKISGYIEPLGRSKYMIPAAGLVYVSGAIARNPKLQRAGLLTVSSLLINDPVTKILKTEFQRRRPDASSENHYFEGGEGGRHHASFPSAHTSTAFTFATSMATVYKDHKWVPPVAYGAATLVGLSRIHDNKHWATDVLAGATVGFITAKTTNFLLNQIEKQLDKKKINIYVLPKVSNGTAGLSLGGSF